MPATTKVNIPAPLIEAMKSGRIILFLGAGASMEAKSKDGKRALSGKQLAQVLAQRFLGEELSDIDLMQVAEMASRVSSQNVVFDWIGSELKELIPSSAHKLIPTFQWHTIATT